MSEPVVIVGGSVAGVRAAQALRSEGYEGGIVLVDAEPHLPYDKPPLSKGLLAGAVDEPAVTLLTRREAESLGIRLLLGRPATGVDVANRRLELADGARVEFHALVVATGARARPSPWGQLPGVHLLRTLQDARRLRADLLRGGYLVVVGAGFIGSEVTSTARALGLDVTIVDPLLVPMGRVLGDEVGRLLVKLHHRHGVRLHLGVGVEHIDGQAGGLQVRLTNGASLHADTVVVGIGAQANDEWLATSGMHVDDGLVCDAYCRAVDTPNVYAAGDVARWHHPSRGVHMRIEHWTNAVEQATCVAHNLAHPEHPRPYAPVEYVWSDQHDWRIQVAGRTGGLGDPVVLGEPDGGRFTALYPDDDGEHLGGAVAVNWARATVACRRALRTGGRLADVHAALASATDRPAPEPVAR